MRSLFRKHVGGKCDVCIWSVNVCNGHEYTTCKNRVAEPWKRCSETAPPVTAEYDTSKVITTFGNLIPNNLYQVAEPYKTP